MISMDEFEKAVGELKLKDIVVSSILTGLGFLVALTWRDAIQQTINFFVPTGDGLLYLYLAAIIVTGVAVAIGYILVRLQKLNLELLHVLDMRRKERTVVKKKVRVSSQYD